MNSKRANRPSVLAAAIGAVSGLAASGVLAQSVVFDGTMGPTGSLSGDMVISNDYGTQVGANLFHSFTIFNVLTGESATFTSNYAGATHNVIARITGGGHSMIDGPLVNAIPGANLWLINPGGVAFGPNAEVDVQGSFHVSTADYLLLDDGGRFSAHLDDASGTILTLGNPTTFGFLGPTAASIGMNASVTVPEGQSISLTAGDISLNGGTLLAPGGQVSLTAISGAGEVSLSDTGPILSGFDGRGSITLEGGALVDVSADAGGSVFIHGGQFLMADGSVVGAETGDQDGGTVAIDVGNLEMRQASVIDAGSRGEGNAVGVMVAAADSVSLRDGSFITTDTRGSGNGGNISVTAGNRIEMSGWSSDTGWVSGLFSNSTRFGNSGNIHVSAPMISLENGAQVNSSASFFGDAGNVTIDAPQALYVAGESGDGVLSGIFTSNTSRGNAGDVSIAAGDVTFLNGAHIMGEAGTFGGRSGGDSANVTIDASGDVLFRGFASSGFTSGIFSGTNSGGIAGTISISGNDISLIQGGGIVARAVGGGAAGQIYIKARGDFTMDSIYDGVESISFISVEMVGEGNGGIISIEAENVHLLNGSEVILRNTETGGGAPGRLSITARDTIYQIASSRKYSSVFAEGFGEGASSANITYNAENIYFDGALILTTLRDTEGSAGSITLNGSTGIFITGFSQIGSNSFDASQRGGDIFLNTSDLEINNGSYIFTNTYFESGGAGNVYITADELRIADASIDAGSCFCSSGDAGGIFVNVSGNIYLSGTSDPDDPSPAGIRSQTLGSGNGGVIDISAGGIFISDGAAIITSSVATVQDFIDVGLPGQVPGTAGAIFISADYLEMTSGGSIQSAAIEAAGGNISLDIGEFIYMTDASISAEAQGVTPEDDGGNVTISGPTAIVMNHSAIRANANAGNGGNINIATEVLVPSVDSVLDASSQTGVDGQVVIDSPNQAVSSVALLETPVLDVAELVQDPCEVDVNEQRSSLTVEGQGGLRPAPDDFQSSPPPNARRKTSTILPGRQPALAQKTPAGQCEETGP